MYYFSGLYLLCITTLPQHYTNVRSTSGRHER